jgi:hypothetical protein
MRYELLDYQREAATGVLDNLVRGRDDWNRYRSLSSFALSAITGAGKTVIASAVIEAILHGSSDLDVKADPRATFLWVTDDPALNRQTRNKMLDASDLLAPARLIVLDNDFLDSQLSPGRVYFLNVQKLSKNAGLAQGGVNLRQHSMWEVLGNTVNGGMADLHVVLDEAHRGMKQASDRKTIVHRIISGQQGSNPPVPVVWGISATIERFTRAMSGVTNRTSYPYVEVDIEKVRTSGLIKDEIGLDQPDEKGTFSTTLLRDAIATTVDFERRWSAYSTAEDEPGVLPVLVIQVPDKATTAKLAEIVAVVDSQWPGLGPRAVAHVLGEHETISLGDRIVEWVQPESIQTEADIRVVLAKEAISTGWDCPRAEVLYSERPAKDVTHIAQVVGRMVRQPLAHRITTDDALNSVACYLPLFDRSALSAIKAELEGKGTGNGDSKVGPEVVRSPRIFERNPHIEQGVFDAIESLPSIPTPDVLANPLRRAKNLARLLTDDASGKALLPNAGEVLTKTLNAKLDGLAAQFADDVEANIQDIKTAEIHRVRLTPTGQEAGTSTRTAATHVSDIDRDTRKVIASVKEGVGKDYYAYRVDKAGQHADKLEVRIAVAALLQVDGVVEELEATATMFVRDHLSRFAVEIKNTTGATRDAYRKVQEQTSQPEAVTVELRQNEKAATKDRTGADLPLTTSHIFSDADGNYPVDLNEWERTVVKTEIQRDSFVAWYRNPSRALPNALRIAYQDDAEKWGSLQVDFLVVSRRDDGTLAVSIVDPHGDYLADAKSKLRALADFADAHGQHFLRIESITKVGNGNLRYLDLQDPQVRGVVRKFEGGKVTGLYESEVANDYL